MSIELEEALQELRAGDEASFYLIWGEEYLARKAAEELVKALIPPELTSLNYSVLDAVSYTHLRAHETGRARPAPRLRLLADQRLSEGNRGELIADARRASEEVGVVNFTALQSSAKHSDRVALPEHRFQ